METKNCQNCKQDFKIETEDFSFYEKMKVPPPTFCPDCRFQRRLLFRNNRVFYRRECEMCHKSILSVYSKEKPFVIYCRECWLSDKWSPLDYGRDYDFSTPFFSQFQKLLNEVPKSNLFQTNFVNSEYCNYGMDFKECYLSFGGADNERVYFSNQIFSCRDSTDIAFCEKAEFSYEIFECARANKQFWSRNSLDCIESYYLADCRNCINCFGCVGMVNKQYCIWNIQHTKEEYFDYLNSNDIGSFKNHSEALSKLKNLELSVPHRYAHVYKSVNSDGDELMEARNAHYSFSCRQVEDSKFLFYIRNKAKDCHDTCFQGWGSELCYELAHGFGGSNAAFGMRNFFNQDARYNIDCHDCQNIFGCDGLRKNNYCILNKQYSKEEYEGLLPKILEHVSEMPYVDKNDISHKYGEFFPSELSPFSYNETIAQEFFPLAKEDILNIGYSWKDDEARNYKIDIENKNLPDNIKDVDEEIVGKVIACGHAGKCKEQCTEAFKIVPEEFKFYKRMNLPIPRLCPNCRHYQRISQRNPLKLWDRACMCDKQGHFHKQDKCVVEFKTTYAPERLEIVYCEKCYQQEVY